MASKKRKRSEPATIDQAMLKIKDLLPQQKDDVFRALMVNGHIAPAIIENELSGPTKDEICINCGNEFKVADHGHCHYHPECPQFDEEPEWSVPHEGGYYHKNSKKALAEFSESMVWGFCEQPIDTLGCCVKQSHEAASARTKYQWGATLMPLCKQTRCAVVEDD
jgi:hypothetical protein